jgi:hypothetical protein
MLDGFVITGFLSEYHTLHINSSNNSQFLSLRFGGARHQQGRRRQFGQSILIFRIAGAPR